MATSNFCYENRCIVVTNDDYEMDNLPCIGEYRKECNRNFPSYIIDGYEDFNYFDVVITSGYYADACIDYVEKEEFKGVEYYCGSDIYFTNKKELFNELKSNFNHISIYRMRQLCKGLTMEKDAEEIYDTLDTYLKDMEEKRVNKALDGIKQYHGYEEICCVGHFSNGEGVYRKVG